MRLTLICLAMLLSAPSFACFDKSEEAYQAVYDRLEQDTGVTKDKVGSILSGYFGKSWEPVSVFSGIYRTVDYVHNELIAHVVTASVRCVQSGVEITSFNIADTPVESIPTHE